MSTTIHIKFFGQLQIFNNGVRISGFKSRKAEALLIYLLLNGEPQPREMLADCLWDERSGKKALGNLRVLLTNLRQLMPDCFQINRQTAALSPTVTVVSDLGELQTAVYQGEQHNWSTETLSQLRDIMIDIQAPFLQGFYLNDGIRFEEWLRVHREAAERLRLQALDTLTEGDFKQKAFESGIRRAHQLIAIDPLRERSHRLLMRLLVRNGESNEALKAYAKVKKIVDEELGVLPELETSRLAERIRQLKNDPPPQLSRPQTSILGRQTLIQTVEERLNNRACRVCTLVGFGGIGKTRLAQEIGYLRFHDYLNGVFLVSMAQLNGLDEMVEALCAQLGLSQSIKSGPKRTLIHYLRPRDMLIILDNAEHLLAETAELAEEILNQCPDVQLLVTSRERLQMHQEQVIAVSGLPKNHMQGEDWGVALLRERLGQHRQLFWLAAEEELAADICHLVDRSPLGIELAAAVLAYSDLAQVKAALSEDLDILQTRMRNVPQRQRSIRAVFAHSWRLLSEQEQRVFAQLALFRGGFTAQAAQAITGANRFFLHGLQEKSLVRRSENGRHDLHELLRQYAEEKLTADPALEAEAKQKYIDYYAQFMTTRQPKMVGGSILATLKEIGGELSNIQQMWQIAISSQQIPQLKQAWAGLADYFYIRAGFNEGYRLSQQAYEQLSATEGDLKDDLGEDAAEEITSFKQLLLAWQAFFMVELSRYEAGIEVANRVILSAVNDEARVIAMVGKGYALWSMWDFAEAEPILNEALAIASQKGMQWAQIACLNTLGNLHLDLSQVELAQSYCQKTLVRSQELGLKRYEAAARINYGNTFWYLGLFAQANEQYTFALQITREMSMKQLEGLALNNLGLVYSKMGNYPESVRYMEQAIALSRDVGDQRGEGNGLLCLVGCKIEMADYRGLETMLEETAAIFSRIRDQQGEALIHLDWGRWFLLLGQTKAAHHHLAKGEQILGKIEDQYGQVGAHYARAWWQLDSQQFAEAKQTAEKGINLAQTAEDKAGEGRSWSVLGYYATDPDVQDWVLGAHAFAQAIAIYTRSGQAHLVYEARWGELLCQSKQQIPIEHISYEPLISWLLQGVFDGVLIPLRMLQHALSLLEEKEDLRYGAAQKCASAWVAHTAVSITHLDYRHSYKAMAQLRL